MTLRSAWSTVPIHTLMTFQIVIVRCSKYLGIWLDTKLTLKWVTLFFLALFANTMDLEWNFQDVLYV